MRPGLRCRFHCGRWSRLCWVLAAHIRHLLLLLFSESRKQFLMEFGLEELGLGEVDKELTVTGRGVVKLGTPRPIATAVGADRRVARQLEKRLLLS